MAERKATNKYIPPDFDPAKHRSINGYRKSHHLRDRARKMGEGILVVRFEMPFNVWCLHCNKHIGQGVRYNADKKKIGYYFSTPIFEFRMKCHLCSGWMTIHTDPKNTEYVCVEGVRRKIEAFEETTQIKLQDEEHMKRLREDPLYKLEHEIMDRRKYEDETPELEKLQSLNDKRWADTYANSQKLRKRHREDRGLLKEEQKNQIDLQDKYSLNTIPDRERPIDALEAQKVNFQRPESWNQYQINSSLESKEIFPNNKTTSDLIASIAKKQKTQQELFYNKSSKSLKGIVKVINKEK